ncbi:hypothetical protein OPV22_026780 [Ensete ventricosum]|uniref:Cyclin C-terminal domain-containing protein n=1 Tax=Ensete ventricosum TaxID=4639 RepID=A0AAV8PTE5_ENSVE|nr:hypothetical protein OPV22_026780 [Ensete ventricosum]
MEIIWTTYHSNNKWLPIACRYRSLAYSWAVIPFSGSINTVKMTGLRIIMIQHLHARGRDDEIEQREGMQLQEAVFFLGGLVARPNHLRFYTASFAMVAAAAVINVHISDVERFASTPVC